MIGVYRVFLVCLGVFCLSCFGATAKSMDSNLGKRKHPNNGYQIQSTKFKSDFSPIARKSVAFPSKYSAGTIVIRTGERRLYHVTAEGRALAYGIGVGKTGFTWSGSNKISRKAEWPGWTPPARMRAREAKKGRILPAYMPGGPNNPSRRKSPVYWFDNLSHSRNQPAVDDWSRHVIGLHKNGE